MDDLNRKKITVDLWKLSYPTMLSMGFQSVYDIVDMIWIGQISKNAISGVALFTSFYFLFAIFNDIAGSSSVAMISQTYGKGDIQKTCRIAEQTISFKVVLAIISAVLFAICLRPLLYFFIADEKVITSAIDYGWIRIFFMPIMFSSFSVNTIFRCTGDAKMPMYIMFISAVLNLILDPIFMFDIIPSTNIPGYGMGVFGAALATVIARGISFLFGFIVLLKGRRGIKISFKGLFRLDKDIDKNLLVIGIPSGFNSLVRSLSQVVVLKFVAVYGAGAIALAGVGGKFMQFIFMPLFGFNSGGSTLVGHSLGKENIPEARLTSKIAAVLSFLVIALFAILVFFFGKSFLLLFFPNDPSLIAQGYIMLNIFFQSSLLLGLALGLDSAFSGSGYLKPLLYATFAGRWLAQFPYLILVVPILHLPLHFVWLSFLVAEIAEFSIVFYHYKKGVWESKRV